MVAVRHAGSAPRVKNATASLSKKAKYADGNLRMVGVPSFRVKLAGALDIPRRRMIGVTQGGRA
jgi:hypothetical protein